jgi:hypothetical protein
MGASSSELQEIQVHESIDLPNFVQTPESLPEWPVELSIAIGASSGGLAFTVTAISIPALIEGAHV